MNISQSTKFVTVNTENGVVMHEHRSEKAAKSMAAWHNKTAKRDYAAAMPVEEYSARFPTKH